MRVWGDQPAIAWQDRLFTYDDLTGMVATWQSELPRLGIDPGAVVAIKSDYSPNACALLLSLIDRQSIIVPLAPSEELHHEDFLATAQVERVLHLDDEDRWQLHERTVSDAHPLVGGLRKRGHPGLVLFSSGSTGKHKAALHDFFHLLEKFKVPRQRLTTLNFLLFDHIGGINTLFYTLSNGGVVVFTASRNPDDVSRLIQQHRVQLLPTSPTFLNLLIMTEAYNHHDLSSLELVTYGTEMMPHSTLQRLQAAIPNVRLQQTYGMTELGILRSKSEASDSLWVKLGGEGTETKVANGTLWIRTQSAMLGYLNAPSPFDEDGWMDTHDLVEVQGEYVRFLGRQSEIINVGGHKVSPAEVESTLLQMDNVRDASVFGEPNPITGHIVVAEINLIAPEPRLELQRRVRAFCGDRLARYKVPAKIIINDQPLHTARFKKSRRVSAPESAPSEA
jgi:acyl-coenzyme A synthetase/AMP-(fatty) acid ligase